jgi:hypothetical protein
MDRANGCTAILLIAFITAAAVGIVGAWIINLILASVGSPIVIEWWHVSLIWVFLKLIL